MNEMDTIRAMTSIPKFVKTIINKISSGFINYYQLTILYATLNKNQVLIQNNYSKMNKPINALILRKQDFINILQESNDCPQWLKEIGVQQINNTFTDFAERVKEKSIEI